MKGPGKLFNFPTILGFILQQSWLYIVTSVLISQKVCDWAVWPRCMCCPAPGRSAAYPPPPWRPSQGGPYTLPAGEPAPTPSIGELHDILLTLPRFQTCWGQPGGAGELQEVQPPSALPLLRRCKDWRSGHSLWYLQQGIPTSENCVPLVLQFLLVLLLPPTPTPLFPRYGVSTPRVLPSPLGYPQVPGSLAGMKDEPTPWSCPAAPYCTLDPTLGIHRTPHLS